MSQPAPRIPDNSLEAAARAIRSARGHATKFACAFDQSLVPMVMVDNERRYRMANRAARLLFRLSLDQLQRHTIDDLTPPDMLSVLESAWSRLHRDGQVAGLFDARFRDGSTLRLSYRAAANFLPGQHLIVFAPSDWPRAELGLAGHGAGLEANAPITPREREVLALVATGADSSQIAARLTISPETVRSHTKNALRKLGARNRAHAIAMATRLKLIDPAWDDGAGDRDGDRSVDER